MKKGIFLILLANIINLILGIVTGFVLPKYLSISAYGDVKTYQLYISYIGFLHLGFIDGIYLVYGGKNIDEIDHGKYIKRLKTFKVFQILVSILTIMLSVVLKDIVLLLFAFSIYTYNLGMYYKLSYQALSQYGRYSRIINFTTILTVIGFILLMLLHVESGISFIIVYVVCYAIVALVVDCLKPIKKRVNIKECIDIEDSKDLVKSGFLLMLGNFSALILTGMDRWCIKLLMHNGDAFSFYSFAVSLQAMLEVVVSPLTIVFYNVMCNEKDNHKIDLIKRYCILLGLSLMAASFCCKFIVEFFLKTYIPSINVIFILFATELLYVLIRGIYVNLYKAQKKQSIYFRKLVYVIVIALILNLSIFWIYRKMEAFAYATFISTFIWLIMCLKDFKDISLKNKEIFSIIVCYFVYFVVAFYCSAILGLLLYLCVFIFVTSLVYNHEYKELIGSFINKLFAIIRKLRIKNNE